MNGMYAEYIKQVALYNSLNGKRINTSKVRAKKNVLAKRRKKKKN